MTRALIGITFLAIAATGTADLQVSKCSIVTQRGATKTELFAAHELQTTLSQVTGKEIPIIEATRLGKNQIVVGPGPLARKLLPTVNWTKLGPEQTLVRTKGSDLVIAGGAKRGTMYAVYRFLQVNCGVRWWAPWATTIPTDPNLTIPALNWTETPGFEYREPYWSHTNDPDWSVRNFDNGTAIQADDSRGGKTVYQGFVHTYYPLVPPDPYFKTHPEWYSLIDGKRTTESAQLCTTNQALRDFIVAKVIADLKANPQATIVSVSQNDCFRPCQCDVCRALVAQEGSEAALTLDLANYVADHIKDEFPNVGVDTLAYQWSRHPTKTMKPRANVIIRLCSIEGNFAHPLSDLANKAFGDDIRGWNKLTNRLYVWDYCTDFAHYLQPQPDYFSLGQTLRWFSQNGVKGVFEEGDYSSSGGDMAELKAWVIAQMLWNPKQDPDALVDEFLKGYYGPAAAPIRQYLELMTAEAQSSHVSFAMDSNAPYLRYDVMVKAHKLWTRAKQLTASNPTFAARVDKSSLSEEWVWLQRWNEFKTTAQQNHDDWPFANKRSAAAASWLARAQDHSIPGYPPITALDEGMTPPKRLVDSLGQ